jgi:hypothetical protein
MSDPYLASFFGAPILEAGVVVKIDGIHKLSSLKRFNGRLSVVSSLSRSPHISIWPLSKEANVELIQSSDLIDVLDDSVFGARSSQTMCSSMFTIVEKVKLSSEVIDVTRDLIRQAKATRNKENVAPVVAPKALASRNKENVAPVITPKAKASRNKENVAPVVASKQVTNVKQTVRATTKRLAPVQLQAKFEEIEPSKRDSVESSVSIRPRSTKKKRDNTVATSLAVAAGNSVAAPAKLNAKIPVKQQKLIEAAPHATFLGKVALPTSSAVNSSSNAVVAAASATGDGSSSFVIPEPGVNGAIPGALKGKTIVFSGIFVEVGDVNELTGKDRLILMVKSFGGKVIGKVSGKWVSNNSKQKNYTDKKSLTLTCTSRMYSSRLPRDR